MVAGARKIASKGSGDADTDCQTQVEMSGSRFLAAPVPVPPFVVCQFPTVLSNASSPAGAELAQMMSMFKSLIAKQDGKQHRNGSSR